MAEARSWSDDVTPPEGERQRPPTDVAVKLAALGWGMLYTVPDKATNAPSYYLLECGRDAGGCGALRRLVPDARRYAAVPEDWGPPHRCPPVGTAA